MQKPNGVVVVVVLGSFSSSVDTVWGFIGDSVLLSCSIPESELQEDLNVHWRDDEGKNVFDITGNKTIEDQALKYKNRVETFHDEQKKGNVSIKLNGLQKTDARTYFCIITGPFQKQFKTKINFKGVYNLKIFFGKTEIMNEVSDWSN